MNLTENSSRADGERISQLDGIRWIAVFMVMVSHYLHASRLYGDFGGWGVQIFFVLSGFLIGGLLLKARGRVQSGEKKASSELIYFYARRAIRIFPAFYVLLAICLLLGNWSSNIIFWSSIYSINIWEVINGLHTGVFGHIYTLCMEEHFYLLFPLIVLFSIKRNIDFIFYGLIVVGWIYRGFIVDCMEVANSSRLVFYQFDALVAGALLARLMQQNVLGVSGGGMESNFRSWGWLPGSIYFLNFYMLKFGAGGIHSGVFEPFLFTLFACWVVYRAALGVSGLAGSVLGFRPFVYLGSISYGIYLYHNFAGWFVANALLRISHFVTFPSFLVFFFEVFWSIGIAMISWHLIEAPCNRLKKFL